MFTIMLILLFFAGCMGTIDAKIEEYIGKTPDCAVSVVDERPDKRIVVEVGLGDHIAFNMVPPIKDILSLKICQNPKIKQHLGNNEEIKVIIEDVKPIQVDSEFYTEFTLYLIGYIQEDKQKVSIRTSKTKKLIAITRYIIQDMINQCTDDFVKKIEEHLNSG
jgi:hypothetical protein